LEWDLIRTPAETFSLAGQVWRHGNESLSVKAVDEWLAFSVDRVELSPLVFKNRIDIELAETIRLPECRKAAPGDLYSPSWTCQPEIAVSVFGLRRKPTAAQIPSCGINLEAPIPKLG